MNIPNCFFFFFFLVSIKQAHRKSSSVQLVYGFSSMQCLCKVVLLQEGDSFQGLRVGSCLTPGNELSRETHELTKQKILLERCLAEPRRTALPRGSKSWVLF